jgi:hypothetical protein
MFAYGTVDDAHCEPWVPRNDLQIEDILDIVEDASISHGPQRGSFEEHLKHHAIPMTHPFNALCDAKFIGRFESIDRDWMQVCKRVGVEMGPLPLSYSSKKGSDRGNISIRPSITGKTRLRVMRIYAADFKKLNYNFY